MSRFLQAALDCLYRGFSVIPLKPAEKVPMPGIGPTARSRESFQITHWARTFPAANVGICADENFVILESDDIDAFTDLLERTCGASVPETLMACGSSESRPHFFFKATKMSVNVGNLAMPGVFEARFSNQYVVGPGSIHPNGSEYRWLNNAPIVEIPDELCSALVFLAQTQKGEKKNPGFTVTPEGRVLEGGRHYFIFSELGKLWNGRITEEELLQKAMELDLRCDPPKGQAHALQCVRDVMKRKPFDPGPKILFGMTANPTVLNTATASSKFKMPKVEGQTKEYILNPLNSRFDGWFPRGRVSIIGGSSGVGKTTLVVDLLHKQRKGEKYLGHLGAGLAFVILFADRTILSNRETLERMGFGTNDMPIAYMPVSWDETAADNIQDRIEQYGCPPAVFVEGADALVSDANKAQVVAPFLSRLQGIAEYYHTALILSCGAPKSKPKDQYAQTRDRIFGSQMWARMAEDILVLSYDTDDALNETRCLTVEHRNAKREKFNLIFSDGLLVEKPPSLTTVKEVPDITDAQSQMIQTLQTMQPGERIHTGTSFPYLSSGTVSKYLKELSRPPTPWVEKDGNNWVVANRSKGETNGNSM